MGEKITRRIDDLGRIVIPKVIRKSIRLNEGDTMEITVDEQGNIILVKVEDNDN